jgi:dTDP-4-amino-4,6-dideoxygalactose transaminase
MKARIEGLRFNDPAADFRELEDEISSAVLEVMARGDYIRGRAVEEFETEFARALGARFAVGVATGTDALVLGLRAAGIGAGHEVITAANTFTATAMAIALAGARPALADVDPETLNLDPARLEAALTKKTRAVVPVHLYGQPADMREIMAWARARGLTVIEDACQAHGAMYGTKAAGTMGLLGAFSFYPSKNLAAAGDAGMVVTGSKALAEKIRMLANYGSAQKDRHEFLGTNSRLDSLQAAILRVKLTRLFEWNRRRREHAAIYCSLLEGSELVRLPALGPGRTHVYHQFVVRVRARLREPLRRRLARRGVPTMVHYPVPVHLQRAFAFLGLKAGSFPAAEAAAREIISLPVHQHLTADQVQFAASALLDELQFLARRSPASARRKGSRCKADTAGKRRNRASKT